MPNLLFVFFFLQFQNITLSVNDLLACCGFRCGEGCDGGYPVAAWQYFSYSGVVTEEVKQIFNYKTLKIWNWFLLTFG